MSSLHDGQDQAATLLGVSWTFTAVSTIFMAARLFCRISLKNLGWDDFWMSITLVLSWTMSILWTVYSNLGGTSYAVISPDQEVTVQHLNWISQAVCISALAVGKIAIATLILRLQAPSKGRTAVLLTMVGVGALWAIVLVIVIFTQCSPSSTLWDPMGNPNGKCLTPWVVVGLALSLGAYYAIVDIVLAIISVLMIWNLQMPLKKRIGICCLLSTGLVAAAMAIVKTCMLPGDLARGTDLVRLDTLLFVWNAIEVNVVISAGCVPTVAPLFELLRGRDPRTKRTATPGNYGASYGSNKGVSRKGFVPMGSGKDAKSWSGATRNEEGDNIPLADGIRVTKTVDVTESMA